MEGKLLTKLLLMKDMGGRRKEEPHLYMWKKYYSVPITHTNICHFIAFLYYMGICKLPCKADYWSTYPLISNHKITTMLGMTREWFNFIWRHFHVQSENENYQEDISESEDDNSKDEEEKVMEQTMVWVYAEEEESNMNELSVNMSDGDDSDMEGGELEINDKEGKVQEERGHPHKKHVWNLLVLG
eukprot:13766996-Ditylum_brightwellii.AAC.1